MSESVTRELPITKEQLAELTQLGIASQNAQRMHALAIRMVMAGHGMPDVVPTGVGGSAESPTLIVSISDAKV